MSLHSHKEARRIIKMLWALTGLILVTSLVVILSMGWGVLSQRDQLAELDADKIKFNENTVEIRLLLSEVRTSVLKILNPEERMSKDIGRQPVLGFRDAVVAQLKGTPEAVEDNNRLVVEKATGIVDLLQKAHDWRQKNDALTDDIDKNLSLDEVRRRLREIHINIDDVIGRERIRSALKILEYKRSSGAEADRLSHEIVDIHLNKIRGTRSNILSDLADIQRLVEVLAGEDQYDHLSDIKDNKLQPSLDRLQRDLRSLRRTDGKEDPVGMAELEALKVALFGPGYNTDRHHQTIHVTEGGFYTLRREYLLTQLAKKRLHDDFENQVFAFELDWANFVQTEQRRQKNQDLEMSHELSETWIYALLTSLAGVGIFLVLIRLVFKAIAKQVDTLAYLRRKAETSSDSKSNFLASMSHELRTPLNAIIGFSEVMKVGAFGSLGNKKYEEYANDIHLSGKHLLNIIDDILDISSIEADEFKIHEKEFGFSRALDEALLMVKMQAKEAQVLIESDAAYPKLRLWGDDRLIKQIIVNLLSNAIKFTPEKGTVRIAQSMAKDGQLKLTVTDTGIGMDEAGVATALTPFGMVNSAYEASNKGTGLGLPLAKKMMEIHGGAIEIFSQLDVGTEVNLYFPATRVIS